MKTRARKTGAVTFETVRDLALALPGVEEGTMYGSPALKVQGKLLACIAVHSSAEKNSLAVKGIEAEERAAIIADDPNTFYFTPHYANYPCVLVRLSKVRRDTLRGLLEMCWRRVAPKRLVQEFDRRQAG
jgi:hypothetical protein